MLQEFVNEIKKLFKDQMKEMHTILPGEILTFDPATGLADVQPVMKFKLPNGTTVNYPQIYGVPVMFPQTVTASITYPVKTGDGCLLLMAEQSIDYWMYGQETDTTLAFDLTNAICIPGLLRAVTSVMTEACQRNAVIVDVKGTRLAVTDGIVEITAENVMVNGDLTVTGQIISSDKGSA